MINRGIIFQVLIIAVLVVLQVFVFSNMNFSGFANPFFYLVFILLFPFDSSRYWFFIASALLGFGIDFWENTGGLHAAATIAVSFARWPLVRFLNGTDLERREFNLGKFNLGQWFIYLLLIVFLHHSIFYCLEQFNFGAWYLILRNIFVSGIFSSLLIGIYLVLFHSQKSDE